MPVPTPKSGEDKTKFLARCHKFLHDENKGRQDKRSDGQISGICYSQWRDKKEGMIHSEPIPIMRSFESEGKKYVYGYAALFDSPDCYGTLCTKEIVESSWEHLQKFPAVRFMHREPLGQILFDESVKGMSTFVDEHGFHVLVQVYDECVDEWGMITSGKWGFSYGLLPAPDGIQKKCLPNGSCYNAFVKGIFYEVSVVDTPAHSDAVAYVIRRFIHGDIGGLSQDGEIEMKDEEIKKLLTDMETRIMKNLKGESEDVNILEESEKRITENVIAAISKQKSASSTADALKEMEARIMASVNKEIQKTEPSVLQRKFSETEKTLEVMQKKINTLKGIESNIKAAGEDAKTVTARITELQKAYDDFSKGVVTSVETVVNRQMKGFDERLSEIENVAEFRSPVTATQKAGSVIRGFGFGSMLDAALEGEEQ